MCFVQIADTESLPELIGLSLIHIIAHIFQQGAHHPSFGFLGQGWIFQLYKSGEGPLIGIIKKIVTEIDKNAIMHTVILGHILENANNSNLHSVTSLEYFADGTLIAEENLRIFLAHDSRLAGSEFPCRTLNPLKGEYGEHGTVDSCRGNGYYRLFTIFVQSSLLRHSPVSPHSLDIGTGRLGDFNHRP